MEDLHTKIEEAQNEYKNQQWGPVRIIHCWPLLLAEQGLAIHLWHTNSPSHGYKLAADWAQHFDPRYGNGLNGPSRAEPGQATGVDSIHVQCRGAGGRR